MIAPEGRVVRPTLRCLLEDLRDEVGPPELRAALATLEADIADPAYVLPVPLAAAEHLVLDKANMLALDEAAPRKPIKSAADRGAIKVKTSDRRGFLWQDPSGAWWLLGTGVRRDYYEDIDEDTLAALAPTDADRRLAAMEAAYIAECEADRDAQRQILSALIAAAAAPGTGARVELFGAVVDIVVDDDADDDVGELTMSWDFVAFDDQDRFPVDLLALVPGFQEIDQWEFLPPLAPGQAPCWYTYVPRAWMEWLVGMGDVSRLLGEGWSPPNPVADDSDLYAHYTPPAMMAIGYVEGVQVTAICGTRFAPSRLPDHFPVCSRCEDALRVFREVAGGER